MSQLSLLSLLSHRFEGRLVLVTIWYSKGHFFTKVPDRQTNGPIDRRLEFQSSSKQLKQTAEDKLNTWDCILSWNFFINISLRKQHNISCNCISKTAQAWWWGWARGLPTPFQIEVLLYKTINNIDLIHFADVQNYAENRQTWDTHKFINPPKKVEKHILIFCICHLDKHFLTFWAKCFMKTIIGCVIFP